MGTPGLEPGTSRLSSGRANQLSHAPIQISSTELNGHMFKTLWRIWGSNPSEKFQGASLATTPSSPIPHKITCILLSNLVAALRIELSHHALIRHGLSHFGIRLFKLVELVFEICSRNRIRTCINVLACKASAYCLCAIREQI